MLDDPFVRSIPADDLPAGTRILVAVSGGPDSIALLHALGALAPARQWDLRVAHINHQLRGNDSDADETFVRNVAAAGSLPVDVTSVDTNGHAVQNRVSLETAARELRYAALRESLGRWPGDIIATGHTRDDQAETVLMRLLRGSGLTGPAAMRPRRGDLVRPLLAVPRASVLQFLQAHNLPFRLDRSNLTSSHWRNRLRLEVLPVLERESPGIRLRLAATAALLQPDADYVRAESSDTLTALAGDGPGELNLALWRALHPTMRRGSLRLLIEQTTGRPPELSAGQLLELERELLAAGPSVRMIRVSGSVTVWLTGRFVSLLEPSPRDEEWTSVAVELPGETVISPGTLRASREPVADREDLKRM